MPKHAASGLLHHAVCYRYVGVRASIVGAAARGYNRDYIIAPTAARFNHGSNGTALWTMSRRTAGTASMPIMALQNWLRTGHHAWPVHAWDARQLVIRGQTASNGAGLHGRQATSTAQ
jgi:hypothetical protein